MKYNNYINGQWIPPKSGEYAQVTNPVDDSIVGSVPLSNEQDVDDAVQAAKLAFPSWNQRPVQERAEYLKKIRDIILRRKEEFVSTIVQELGACHRFVEGGHFPLTINEIDNYLELIEDYPFEEEIENYTLIKEGFGVVACITPWNYPLNQIQRKITPALLAGNSVVVKPASITPLTAMLLTEAIEEAELPPGVFNLVTGSGSKVGDYLAGHPDVDLISFTGSTEVGRNLYHQASSTIKKLVLELGGKSALLYLEGGNLNAAIKQALNTCINNQGQTCSALTRFLVPRKLLEEAEEEAMNYYQRFVKIGDPTDPDTTVGPMSSQAQLDKVKEYIQIGLDEGAELLVGGEVLPENPHYIQPAIFTKARNDMRIAQEEIFGPVLTIIPYDSVEEAIEMANDTIYGLSGAVVGPATEAFEVAKKMRTGNIFVNQGGRNPGAPFGGYQQSGIGRENGVYGLEDYLEIKVLFK